MENKYYYIVVEYGAGDNQGQYCGVQSGDIMDIAMNLYSQGAARGSMSRVDRVVFYSEITKEQFDKYDGHFDI